LSGGLLREIGAVVLPASVRRTALYHNMVDVTLRFLIEEIGQVEGVYPSEAGLAQHFLLRRTASHGIELLGILTIHASPVWVLAALADATGAGHKLIQEISQALKEEGLLDPEVRFETMDQVLDGMERTSARLAQTLNLPPLDVPALRREWIALREELPQIPAAKVPRLEQLERVWSDLKKSAEVQGGSIFTVSTLLAVSTIAQVPANLVWLSRAGRSAARRTGKVLGDALLDHYAHAIEEIARTGLVEYGARQFRPYLRAAAVQFAPEHESATERLIRRKISKPKN
jgi:hypothetical protein